MRAASTVAVASLPIGWLAAGPAEAAPDEPQPGHLLSRCRLVINPSDERTIPDAVIEVGGGRILAVDAAPDVPIPPDAKVIDVREKYVIPGLIDTHGHLYSRTGRGWWKTNPLLPAFYLAAGITAVGDPGSMDFAGDVALRDKIDAGLPPGTRFFLAGEYIEMEPKTGLLPISWSSDNGRHLFVDSLDERSGRSSSMGM